METQDDLDFYDLMDAAREWIADDSGTGEADDLSYTEIKRHIGLYYDGGWSGFVRGHERTH